MTEARQSWKVRLVRVAMLAGAVFGFKHEAPITGVFLFCTLMLVPKRSFNQLVRWFNGELEKGLDRDAE